jgi:hypothetical protein
MLTYWFPAPVSFGWALAFAVAFAFAAVFAVFATLARRDEERDNVTIAALYGVGLGLVAISEFMQYLDIVFGWSLAAAFSMSTGLLTFIAITAAMFAVMAIVTAVVLQIQEESSYRLAHSM